MLRSKILVPYLFAIGGSPPSPPPSLSISRRSTIDSNLRNGARRFNLPATVSSRPRIKTWPRLRYTAVHVRQIYPVRNYAVDRVAYSTIYDGRDRTARNNGAGLHEYIGSGVIENAVYIRLLPCRGRTEIRVHGIRRSMKRIIIAEVKFTAWNLFSAIIAGA